MSDWESAHKEFREVAAINARRSRVESYISGPPGFEQLFVRERTPNIILAHSPECCCPVCKPFIEGMPILYRQMRALGIEPVATVGNVHILSDADVIRLEEYSKKRGPVPKVQPE